MIRDNALLVIAALALVTLVLAIRECRPHRVPDEYEPWLYRPLDEDEMAVVQWDAPTLAPGIEGPLRTPQYVVDPLDLPPHQWARYADVPERCPVCHGTGRAA